MSHTGVAHACAQGCDECNENDCCRRRTGVIPACACECHQRCLAGQDARSRDPAAGEAEATRLRGAFFALKR